MFRRSFSGHSAGSVGPPRLLSGSYGHGRPCLPAASPQGRRCHLNICHFVQLRVIARPQRLSCIIYRGKSLCAVRTRRGEGAKATSLSSVSSPEACEGKEEKLSHPSLLPVSSSAVHTISCPSQDHQRGVCRPCVSQVTGHLFTSC